MTGQRISTGATLCAAGLVATLAWTATPQADAAVRQGSAQWAAEGVQALPGATLPELPEAELGGGTRDRPELIDIWRQRLRASGSAAPA